MKTAIVTGSAGFVGFFISKLLLEAGYRVIGIDCFSDYYDVKIKKAREEMLLNFSEYRAVYTMIEKMGLGFAKISDVASQFLVFSSYLSWHMTNFVSCMN